MCLDLSLFARRKTTKHDIEVCKVICVPLESQRSPFTPYQHYEIQIGAEYSAKLERSGWKVERGLHSYADLSDAMYKASMFFHTKYNVACYNGEMAIKVFKAIIPKGSQYYFGKHGIDGDSYASNRLIITDEVLHELIDRDVPLY